MDNGNALVQLALVGLALAIYLIDRHDITKLLNRVMAKDYKEFQYFEHKYEKDVQAVEDVRAHDKKKLAVVLEQVKKANEDEQHDEDMDAWDTEEDKLYGAHFAGKNTKAETEK
jgi:hypothetical protein